MDDKKTKIKRGDTCCPETLCGPVDDVRRKYRAELPNVVDAIVESCHDMAGQLSQVDTAMLPSREETTKLIHLMMEIVFPGYFGEKEVDWAAIPYHIGSRASELMERLGEQVSRTIRHECRRTSSLCSDCVETGRKQAYEFMTALPGVRKMAAGDVRAAFRGDPAAKSYEEIIFCYPGLFAISVYRLAHELYKLGVPVLPRIMTEHAHAVTGIDIHPGASIGEEFFIDHGTGVVIGETCVIGAHVTIYQGVTLGALSFQRDSNGALVRGTKRHPTIEDNVVIYSGATILGGETIIGDGSVVGGNVWLTQSLPPGSKVTIASPKLVFHQPDKE